MKRKVLSIPFFLMLFNSTAITQPDLKFESFGHELGIPDMFTVLDIVQDRQGFLWLASNKYLIKYDGYKLKNYNNNSMPENPHDFKGFIRSLFVDRDNNLWLLTNKGLSLYLRDKDLFEDIQIYDDPVLSYPGHRIQEDNDGLLWATTESNGLLSFNKITKEVKFFRHKEDDSNTVSTDSLKSMVFDGNHFWICTINKGIDKMDIANSKFTNVHHSEKDSNSLASNVTKNIYRDKSGILWIALDKGRFDEFHPATGEFRHHEIDEKLTYPELKNVYPELWERVSFFEDDNNNIWITSGLPRRGIYLYNKLSGKISWIKNNPDNPQSLRMTSVYVITSDRSGIIWIGEDNKGFTKFVPDFQEFRYYNEFEDTPVNAIKGDGSSQLWIGSSDGLYRYDKHNDKFDVYFNDSIKKISLTDKIITSLTFDKDSNLWIGTSKGLNQLDLKNNQTKFFKSDLKDTNTIQYDYIRGLFSDSNGNLWISYITGLDKYDLAKKQFIHYPEFKNWHVNAMYEDKNGVVWFGEGDVGLFYYDKDSGKVIFSEHNTLYTRNISMAEDKNDNLWLTSCYSGLTSFDRKTGITKSYTKDSGLASNCIYSILADDNGHFWLATKQSVTFFDPHTGRLKNFSKDDGLRQHNFINNSSYKDKDGRIYFGYTGGMLSFHPDSIRINKNIPNIVFTDFRIFNESILPRENSQIDKHINVADKINLSYNDNSFSFEFAALDYRNPKKNEYAYKMEGFNKDWVYSGTVRTASYTNLDPGEYTFRVKGSNNDGIWNETGSSIKVIITPPWYLTWWFRGCGLLMLVGVLAYTRHRKLSKMRIDMKNQEEFTRQLIDAQESERKRIAGELHDSLGQNLLIIKNKALLGKKNPDKSLDVIDDISNISSSSLEEVREIAYNLHPYQLEQLGLTKAIESIIDRASESGSVIFVKKLYNINDIFSPGTEINLFRMIQECINNILKHSEADRAYVTLTKGTDEISVIIEDNGKGFDVAESKSGKSLGLMSLYERAKMSGANVEISSQPGKGTMINILISLTKN